MSRDDRTAAMELRQKVLPAGEYGEFAAAPEVDSSFGRNVTRRRGTHATFGSEARGAVIPQIAEGHSQTSGHAHQFYTRGETNVTAYVGHSVWGASSEDSCIHATASARARRNGAQRLRPPPFKLPDDPRYRPVKAVIIAARAVSFMQKLAGVPERRAAPEGGTGETGENAGGGNRWLAKLASGGAAAAPPPAAVQPRPEALDMHMHLHMPAYQPPLGALPPFAPQPFAPQPFAPQPFAPPPFAPHPSSLNPPAYFPVPPAVGHGAMFPPHPRALAPSRPPPPPPGFAKDWPMDRWQAWHAERGILPPPGLWEHFTSLSG